MKNNVIKILGVTLLSLASSFSSASEGIESGDDHLNQSPQDSLQNEKATLSSLSLCGGQLPQSLCVSYVLYGDVLLQIKPHFYADDKRVTDDVMAAIAGEGELSLGDVAHYVDFSEGSGTNISEGQFLCLSKASGCRLKDEDEYKPKPQPQGYI